MTSVLPFKSPTYDPTDSGNFPNDGPLRIGGVAVSGMPEQEANLPSTPSPAAKAQQDALRLVRDLWCGTGRLRDQASAYLLQSPGEDSQDYQLRLKTAVLFNVFRHTIIGLVGFMFRRDPVLGVDVPDPIREHLENVDLAGTHFDVFCHDLAVDAQVAGHAAILVDFPATGGTQAKAAELGFDRALPIRPYWVQILKENILSWRTTIEDGAVILSQLVLREAQWVPDGAFGEKEQVRYRVFFRHPPGLVGFQLLEVDEQRRVTEVDRGLYPTQTEIPIAEIPTVGRKGLFESDPPHLDLAFLNVLHYQMQSDYGTSIHKTCVPIWVETGVPETDGVPAPVVLGPNVARVFSNAAAQARYEAHDGQALGSVKQALDDLLRDMAALGLAALASQKRAAETAASKQIDKDASDSALSSSARGIQDGLERALGFHAKYLRLPIGGSVEVNRNYDDTTMPADLLTAYVGAVAQAGLPPRILLEAMQSGGLIGADEDLDVLEAEMTASAAAAADAKAAAQRDLLAGMTAPAPARVPPPAGKAAPMDPVKDDPSGMMDT